MSQPGAHYRRIDQSNSKYNYELFNCNNLNIQFILYSFQLPDSMSLLLLFIITGMGPWIQYYKVGFFKFQPNKYGPPISFRPFMPLYGRQLQSGTHNALIGP
ncbi:transmembrane protein, putative [Medicago truncatula]|uniref:Transmembrane protein, putative n=1 Tax=Medicago truncatula TaxID=3880 RepID=G7L945_MEDTR|nr:transmembrane protein, putative [Medicago truncatula]